MPCALKPHWQHSCSLRTRDSCFQIWLSTKSWICQGRIPDWNCVLLASTHSTAKQKACPQQTLASPLSILCLGNIQKQGVWMALWAATTSGKAESWKWQPNRQKPIKPRRWNFGMISPLRPDVSWRWQGIAEQTLVHFEGGGWCHLGSKKKWTSTSFKLQKFKLEKTQIYQQFSGEPEVEVSGEKKSPTSQRKNVRSGGESGLHKVAGSGYDSSCNPTVEKTLADCRSRSASRLGSSVLVEFLSPKHDLQVRFIGIWWFGSLLEGTAFHIPNFVLLCYIHSRYLLTFIPPICDLPLWNSSPTTSDRASFPNLDWTQANTGVGLIQCLGPKHQFVCFIATIWMLKFYAVQVPQVLCRSKFQTTWEPFGLLAFLLQDFRLTGMLSADPKARKFEAFSFGLFAHFVGNGIFAGKSRLS